MSIFGDGRIERRGFLKLGAALGAGVLVGCGDSAGLTAFQAGPTAGGLDAVLEVRMAENMLGGLPFRHRSYNGLIGGPLLRTRPGQTLRLRVSNLLGPNPDPGHPADPNIPHHFNTTNLHTHGFHVDPTGVSDNVFLNIEPGEFVDYVYEIPANHPAGTYWYHPHKHGSATVQMFSGMAGMIIMEGDIDQVPEIAAAKEVPFVIQALQRNPDGEVPDYTSKRAFRKEWRVVTVNGEVRPAFRIRPGEVQRFRALNASVAWTHPLEVEGHTMHGLAFDGLTYPQVSDTQSERLAPGNRFDFLIRGGAPGIYRIVKRPYQQANPAFGSVAETPEIHLANLVVEGDPVTGMGLPTTLPAADLPDILPSEITGQRTLVYRTEFDNNGPSPEFPDNFTIDGRRFDPDFVGQTVQLGAVEEWTITNPVNDTEHPFHIHVNPFQVVAINGQPVAPRWQDTVILPREGSVTMRTRFEDFTGKFVNHCHMLGHEDQGMMQIVEVVN
jgi:FtsP/CotA-like multicopper oxidase with cupredoxin domain